MENPQHTHGDKQKNGIWDEEVHCAAVRYPVGFHTAVHRAYYLVNDKPQEDESQEDTYVENSPVFRRLLCNEINVKEIEPGGYKAERQDAGRESPVAAADKRDTVLQAVVVAPACEATEHRGVAVQEGVQEEKEEGCLQSGREDGASSGPGGDGILQSDPVGL